MPPTERMIEKAIECLANTTVNSFTASPPTVHPGQASSLAWNVTFPAGCSPQLFLNNSLVSNSGTRNVEPATTTTYLLIGKMYTVEQTLGTITVNVDTSRCLIQSVHEEIVQLLVRSVVETNLAGTPLSQRSPASVEIDRNGIAVKLRLRVDVPNFFDPNLNVNMVIAVRAENQNVVVSYRSFSNDLDWPWWVTGITFGISKFIEEIIENKIERQIKPLILQKLKEQIDSFLRLLPPAYRLHSLTTQADEIKVMVCPAS